MSFVLLDKPRPQVALITLNRPERMNAMAFDVMLLLPRAVGSSRAFEMMLSGRDVDAAEAERIGLVSRTVAGDQLLDTSYALAERVIGFSRIGVELTKRLLWSSLDASSLSAHMAHE